MAPGEVIQLPPSAIGQPISTVTNGGATASTVDVGDEVTEEVTEEGRPRHSKRVPSDVKPPSMKEDGEDDDFTEVTKKFRLPVAEPPPPSKQPKKTRKQKRLEEAMEMALAISKSLEPVNRKRRRKKNRFETSLLSVEDAKLHAYARSIELLQLGDEDQNEDEEDEEQEDTTATPPFDPVPVDTQCTKESFWNLSTYRETKRMAFQSSILENVLSKTEVRFVCTVACLIRVDFHDSNDGSPRASSITGQRP